MVPLIPGSIGFVVAMPMEATTLGRLRLSPHGAILPDARGGIALSGIGASHAREAALGLVARGARALVSWGVCGALSPGLAAGALVIPAEVRASDGQTHETSMVWRARLGELLPETLPMHTGSLIEVLHVVTAIAEKQELHRRSGAVAVDMESAAVAGVAAGAGFPFIAIRAVVDSANTVFPACLGPSLDQAGMRGMSVMRTVCAHPSDWPALIRLGLGLRAARRTLRCVAAAHASGVAAGPTQRQ